MSTMISPPRRSQTGPFYDLSAAQWEAVRATHHRFCKTNDLGRPMQLGHITQLPDVCVAAAPTQPIVLAGPRVRQPAWDQAILTQIRLAALLGQSRFRRPEQFPYLCIPRAFYGHSQRLAEPLGTTTIVDEPHAQAMPSISCLSQVDHLKPKPVKDCPYLSRSLEVLRYFHESTEGRYFIPHMVTTGPCDTVNYATGSTLLLESFYTAPAKLHQLLQIATDLIIEHILACQRIVGDRLLADHTYLLDGCYCICSEIRSQFSAEHYAEFEAPYLEQIARAVGPLHIHVSGPVNQSLPGTLQNPQIKHLKIWLRDCDLADTTRQLQGQVSLDFFRNDCMPALGFARPADFYRHLFENLQPQTRWVLSIYEPQAFNEAFQDLQKQGRLPEQIRNFGLMPQ